MLTLRLEFLTGRYCASSPTNRNEAEWPPHPARVFSALVAAHHDGDASQAGREALQWLERQDAPALHFSQLSPDEREIRDVFDNYVPVNDKAISDASTVKNAWSKVYAATTDKQLAAANKKLATAYEKVGSRAKSLPKSAESDLAHVLPQSRTRQARTFPTVIPSDPVVWLSWDVEPPNEHLGALREITRTLSRVGHSSSLVAANWANEAPSAEPTLVPATDGSETLRWVSPGQLDALEELHQREPFGEQRVMPYLATRYGLAFDREEPSRSLFASEMLVFRRARGPRLSTQHTEALAEAVRGALMHHARDPVPALISGHHAERGTRGDHLAIVALPNAGQPYANGDVLGFGLALPREAPAEEVGRLYEAIANWEKEGGQLRLGRLGVWTMERELSSSRLRTLRPRTWSRPATRWVTATPVLLDRNPGSLRAGSPEKVKKVHDRIHQLLRAACVRIGLPEPIAVEFSREPFLKGACHAKSFRPPSNRRDHRPRVHVALVFDELVEGPVLIGAGRNRGLGLFRPMAEGA